MHQIWNELILCIKFLFFLSLNICYVIYVLLWIKYWLMWFEILLVFILFKFKKRPNISRIRVVNAKQCYWILNFHHFANIKTPYLPNPRFPKHDSQFDLSKPEYVNSREDFSDWFFRLTNKKVCHFPDFFLLLSQGQVIFLSTSVLRSVG